MTEAEMMERIHLLERKLIALQSAVMALSVGLPIRVNADGFIDAVVNPYTTGNAGALK